MKAIVITGCSGAGKTWIMRELFGLEQQPFRYGIKGAIKKGLITINDFTYLPELNTIKGIEEDIKYAVKNSKYLIHDLQWMFRSKFFKFVDRKECRIIHLKPTDTELKERINKRKSDPYAGRSKEDVFNTNVKLIDAIDRLEGFPVVEQLELLDNLKKIVHENRNAEFIRWLSGKNV